MRLRKDPDGISVVASKSYDWSCRCLRPDHRRWKHPAARSRYCSCGNVVVSAEEKFIPPLIRCVRRMITVRISVTCRTSFCKSQMSNLRRAVQSRAGETCLLAMTGNNRPRICDSSQDGHPMDLNPVILSIAEAEEPLSVFGQIIKAIRPLRL
jgi:hypothetical protein